MRQVNGTSCDCASRFVGDFCETGKKRTFYDYLALKLCLLIITLEISQNFNSLTVIIIWQPIWVNLTQL